jgi:hypothetical protein
LASYWRKNNGPSQEMNCGGPFFFREKMCDVLYIKLIPIFWNRRLYVGLGLLPFHFLLFNHQ